MDERGGFDDAEARAPSADRPRAPVAPELTDISRRREVRLADNNGSYEIHQQPGEGTIDFGALFAKIEGLGYEGHYTNGFGTIDDMLVGRDYMVARAIEAGVDVG